MAWGTGTQDGKLRVYRFFSEGHTRDENADFLRKEYGYYGHSAFGGDGFSVNYDGKGATFTKGSYIDPDVKSTLKWSEVAKRISELIAAERYLNPKERDYFYSTYLDEIENQEMSGQQATFIGEPTVQQPTETGSTIAERMAAINPDLSIEEWEDSLADSLSRRLSDYLYMLPDNQREKLVQNGLPNFEDVVDSIQSDALLKDPQKTERLISSLQQIGRASVDVIERNAAYNFALELKDLHPRHLVYQVGDKAYIGAHEYEVLSFDDALVKLYDFECPILTAEMPREEFDRKIAENPSNDRLMKFVEDNLPEEKQPEAILETPRILYKKYLPLLLSELQHNAELYLFLRDNGTDAYEAEERISEWLVETILKDPEPKYVDLLKSYALPKFLDWLVEDLFDLTYQDVPTGISELDAHEGYADVPDWAKRPPFEEMVREDLYAKGFVVSEELIKEGIEEFHARNPIGPLASHQRMAEFIETEFLSKEPEPYRNTSFVSSQEHESKEPIPEPEEQKPIVPSWEQKKPPARANYFDAFPDTPPEKRHNFKIADDELGYGGPKAKFRANMEAIRLLKELELEGRLATPEDQETLSRYVGWGSLPEAFDPKNGSWANEYTQLKSALGAEEYESARASTLNAHYTSPIVIKAMYKAIEKMGFKTGNILDPGCGVGNFQGLLPDTMGDSKIYGIEIDPITGRIAQQIYQKNSIAIQGFEKTALPDSFFDLAIGNVPFGQYGVPDKKYDKHKFMIHDYFFGKTLDKVRPGGVVAFITSKGTMDKQNSAVRKYIAQRAELLGAIRLPNNAFLANAGTQVTSDIIFLQKRDRIIDVDPEWVGLDTTEDGIPINAYFASHPEMVLGTMSKDEGIRMYGSADTATCIPYPDRDLKDLLDEAVQNIHGEIMDYERDEDEQELDNSIPADPSVRNFSYTVVEGMVYFRENSRMVPQELSKTAENRIKGMVEIRDCVRTLIEYQTEDYSDLEIQDQQRKLNRLYDKFTEKYGIISSRANVSAFGSDSSFPLLGALEVLDEDGNLLRKADMFTKRTIRPKTEITHVDTAMEALAISLAEKARVDLAFMAHLTGMESQNIIAELEGVIFKNPLTEGRGEPEYLTADEYLSGNVREKLAQAKELATNLPEYQAHVKALQEVQPEDLSVSEISVRLGATWLPPEVVEEFTFDLLNTPNYYRIDGIKISYSPHTAEWGVFGKNYDRGNVKANSTYGTKRANAYRIIEETLNLRDVRIFDYVEDDNGRKVPVLNKKETMIAQSKQEQIKAAFQEWIWKDPERRNTLVRLYNDKFNSIRPREYDGSNINFVGMNPTIELKEHQVNAVAHVIYGGNTLLAHEVGAGKTYEMVASAMEMKRLGLCNKSMMVVPNHIIEQFAAEWLQLYPSANILVATKKDFEPKNRKKFCARIATGDYDAVIIGHSQFEKIPMSVDFQRGYLEDQLDDLLQGISEAKANKSENFTVKQLEKSRKSLQLKLDKLNDQSRKDNVVTFEQLGVDRLFVDESHNYKNLFLYTKMRNVGGIAQTEAQKSSDMFMKCRYLDEETRGHGVVFATGTPISNSMVELYSIQRYLQYDALKSHGLQHFDAWASTFGETVNAIELSPEGTGYRSKTRFAKFYNIPELMAMFKEVADIQTAETLNLPTPHPNFHNVVIEPSEMQSEMVEGLAERAEKVRARLVDSSTDNMLCITNDGRKLALDQRLMNPLLPDYEKGKAATATENIYRHWDEGKEKRLTQLVFCDLSTPKKDGSFNVYSDVYNKLIAKGVPAEEIAFIHDADTEAKKKELFAKVRQGAVRVLMGSTAKCGAGMNVQDRLVALHDLDVPWRPSDMTQRLGRIKRQGNSNPEVDIYRYVTEKTFDAYSYQLIENKQRFISQIMTSKSPVRSAEDIDEQSLSYAEIKALATGNPLIVEKCDLEMQVSKLKLLKASHLSQRYALEDMVTTHYPAEIKRLSERIEGYTCDIELSAKHPKPIEGAFAMTVNDVTYHEKKDAGQAILETCKAMKSADPVPLGEYRGFQTELSFDSFRQEYHVALKGHISHVASLGTDTFGNIARLDNMIDGFPAKLKSCQERLESTKTQAETAKAEIQKPFLQESELAAKSKRLDEINISLNLDQKDHELVDEVPGEGEDIGAERQTNKGRER